MKVSEYAPAKVNLSLHVTGRRADGYHLLDSLVVFADVGDVIEAEPAAQTTLTVLGPMGRGVPTDGTNLVLKAARLMPDAGRAKLTLHKNLPSASGIGGGSADAAATLRALSRLWDCPLPPVQAQLDLGADIPVCGARGPVRMEGIGEKITPVIGLPEAWLVLVNPMVPVSTGAVFAGLGRDDAPPMQPPPPSCTARAFATWLHGQRNDLQVPAMRVCPDIVAVLEAIAATQPLLCRMSGSGGTCFGLFATATAASDAAQRITKDRPEWWVASGRILGEDSKKQP